MARKETSASTPTLPKLSSTVDTAAVVDTSAVVSSLEQRIKGLQEQLAEETGLRKGLQGILLSMRKSNSRLNARYNLARKLAYRNSVRQMEISRESPTDTSVDNANSVQNLSTNTGSGKMLPIILGMLMIGGKLITDNLMSWNPFPSGPTAAQKRVVALMQKARAKELKQVKKDAKEAGYGEEYNMKLGHDLGATDAWINDPRNMYGARKKAYLRMKALKSAQQASDERLKNEKKAAAKKAQLDEQRKRIAEENKKYNAALKAAAGGVTDYSDSRFADKTEGEGGFFDFSLKEIAIAKHQQRINKLKAKQQQRINKLKARRANQQFPEDPDLGMSGTSGYTDDMLLRRFITRESFPDTDDRDFYRPAWQMFDKRFKRFYPRRKISSTNFNGMREDGRIVNASFIGNLRDFFFPKQERVDFNKVKKWLGHKESTNNYQEENSSGFIGKYQFGYSALIDIGFVKKSARNNDDLNDNKHWNIVGGKQGFLNNPTLQEQAMDMWLEKLYGYLNKSIPGFSKLDVSEQAGLLGAAHLAGADGAAKWYKTGKNPSDAFGTKPSDYYHGLRKKYNNIISQGGVSSTTYTLASSGLPTFGQRSIGTTIAAFKQGDLYNNNLNTGTLYNINPVVIDDTKRKMPKLSVFA